MSINFPSTQTALVRVDYNVPIKNKEILDLTRIEASLPTINYLLQNNMTIVLMSHLGRPKSRDMEYSLKILIKPLEKLIKKDVVFLENLDNIELPRGGVGLLENLRFYPGETNNDAEFSKKLSQLGDIYINDAFSASHRVHASTSGIHSFFPKNKYKGLLLDFELHQIRKLKNNPKAPYTIIVGGSKIGSKIQMLQTFLNIADNILIGGGMAFPFIKYMGGEIGNSIFQEKELTVVEAFLKQSKHSKTKIVLPTDCIATRDIITREDQKVTDIMSIPKHLMGVDIGPNTINIFKDVISNSQAIMWNGPMGVSEVTDFAHGTRSLAESIAQATKTGAYSLIGGGDTISDAYRLGFKDRFSHVSTGGGAMLEFFKDENLPGILNLKSIK